MNPSTARRTWRTLEPLHALVYFAPQAAEHYGAVGLRGGRMGYFASRGAALGPVPAEVVIATFYNFCPALVRRAIPDAWALADPAAVLSARLAVADDALRATLGDALDDDGLAEAAGLARRAAEAAAEHTEGRALFAGHAALPWPDPSEAHLVLWHAQTLLREFRGDGHIAALVLEGCTGIEALVVHAATGEIPAAVLQASRAWPDDEWSAAVERLRDRGWVAPGDELALTDAGRAHRQRVEEATDAAAVAAYAPLGDEGCERLRALARPFSRAVIASGMLAMAPASWDDED